MIRTKSKEVLAGFLIGFIGYLYLLDNLLIQYFPEGFLLSFTASGRFVVIIILGGLYVIKNKFLSNKTFVRVVNVITVAFFTFFMLDIIFSIYRLFYV